MVLPLHYGNKTVKRAIVYEQYDLKGMFLTVISMHGSKVDIISDNFHEDLCPNSLWINSYDPWGVLPPVPGLQEKIIVGSYLKVKTPCCSMVK